MIKHPRNKKVTLRLSKEEEDIIQKKAERLGLSIGVYLRFIGINVDFEIINKNVRQTTDKAY